MTPDELKQITEKVCGDASKINCTPEHLLQTTYAHVQDPDHLEVLKLIAEENCYSYGMTALFALSKMEDKRLVDFWKKILKRSRHNEYYRKISAMALGLLGEPGSDDLLYQVYKDALEKDQRDLRRNAAAALAGIRGDKANQILLDIIKNSKDDIGELESIVFLLRFHRTTNVLNALEAVSELNVNDTSQTLGVIGIKDKIK